MSEFRKEGREGFLSRGRGWYKGFVVGGSRIRLFLWVCDRCNCLKEFRVSG